MSGRDDKWLGMTALAVLQYVELRYRTMVDELTHEEYYPKALRALAWLRRMSASGSMPRDGYIPVTGASRPDPGCNTTWLLALVVDGLLAGPTLESFGSD